MKRLAYNVDWSNWTMGIEFYPLDRTWAVCFCLGPLLLFIRWSVPDAEL